MHYHIALAVLFIFTFLLWKRNRRIPFDWSKQHVAIVGGAGALGQALAQVLTQKKAQILILDVVKKPSTCDDCDMIFCDATDPKQVEETFEKQRHASILINAQGIMNSGQTLINQTTENISRSLSINLLSFLYTSQAFLKYSLAPKYIINITSCLGLGGVSHLTDYCASKFGVFGFSESLRNELRPRKIGVLTVCPFLLQDSPMFLGKVNIKYPFLTRPLCTSQVAEAIIKAVENEKSELYLPWWVNLMGFMRLLPTALFDQIQDILGSSQAFIGQ